MKNYLCSTTSQTFSPCITGLAKLNGFENMVQVLISKICGNIVYLTLDTGEPRVIRNGMKQHVKGFENLKIHRYYAHIHGHSIFEDNSADKVVEYALLTTKNIREIVISWGVYHEFDNGLGLTKHLKSNIIESVLHFGEIIDCKLINSLGTGLNDDVYSELNKARTTLYELFNNYGTHTKKENENETRIKQHSI